MESTDLLSGSSFWLFLAAAWLLTYLVHSTLLLSAALVVGKLKGPRWESFKEGFFKFALLGGFMTATIQLSLGIDPWSGRLPLGIPPVDHDRIIVKLDALHPGWSTHEGALPAVALNGTFPLEGHTVRDGMGPSSLRQEAGTAWSWLLITACAAAACFGSTLLARSWIKLQRLLHDRVDIKKGPLPPILERLCRKGRYHRSIRLTTSVHTAVPMAMSTVRPEICLPLRALSGLSGEEQESMLAHELAHLVRRDPAWLTCFRLVEGVFFLQPLNRLACSRWLECAEYRCDAWAAALVGRGLPLARCLSEVASWLVDPGEPCRGTAAHGMVRNRSSLSRRLSRLIDDSGTARKIGKGSWFATFVPLLLLAVVFAAPGFSVARASDGLQPNETGSTSMDHQEIVGEEPPAPVAGPDLVADFLSLERDLIGLEREVTAVRELVRGTPLEEELGDLLLFADKRIKSLHVKRRMIESLIHRKAAGSGF